MSTLIKHAGVWKEPEMIYVKDQGVWKEVAGSGGNPGALFVGALSSGMTQFNRRIDHVIPGDLCILFQSSSSDPVVPDGWEEAGRKTGGTYKIVVSFKIWDSHGLDVREMAFSSTWAIVVFRGASGIQNPISKNGSPYQLPSRDNLAPGTIIVAYMYGPVDFIATSYSSYMYPIPRTNVPNLDNRYLAYMSFPNDSFSQTTISGALSSGALMSIEVSPQ